MAAAPIIYQRAVIGPKVLDQLTDVLFARERAARTADMRGAEPARQFRQAPEAGTRTTVPKQPLGALEIANRIAAKVASRRVRAQAAGCLQSVLKAHRDVPPVEDQCCLGHDLALKLPQPGIAIGQHRRWRSGADPGCQAPSWNENMKCFLELAINSENIGRPCSHY